MPSRLLKLRPESHLKPGSSKDFPIHQDQESQTGLLVALLPADSAPTTTTFPPSSPNTPPPTSKPARLTNFLHGRKGSRSTLSPASQDAVNHMPPPPQPPASRTSGAAKNKPLPPVAAGPQIPNRMASTIRPVRSFDDGPPPPPPQPAEEDFGSERSSSSTAPSRTTESASMRSSGFSSSTANSNASAAGSSQAQTKKDQKQQIPNGDAAAVRLKPGGGETTTTGSLQVPGGSAAQQRRSGEMGRPSVEVPVRESSRSALAALPNGGRQGQVQGLTSSPSAVAATELSSSPDGGITTAAGANGGWDSTIGKAGLGKTGRVINKLVSDNEALKRDIQIERLRADEARQTARLLEDKMERLASDYEGRLLEASVTKTLLARKERQVESLQAAVELERSKAAGALERERVWKFEMEKARAEAKAKVDEAGNYAALMEGRYNAISGHWREQGEEVRRAMGGMRAEVDELREERRRDDEKIGTLRAVCDQQDGNIRELTRQKEEMARQFEAYKAEQEAALRDIKTEARRREEEQEAVILESREVLDKLKWALNVKENVKWAE